MRTVPDKIKPSSLSFCYLLVQKDNSIVEGGHLIHQPLMRRVIARFNIGTMAPLLEPGLSNF